MSLREKLQRQYDRKVHRLIAERNTSLHNRMCAQVDQAFSPKSGERKLRIAYVMNHALVCGGTKILLEHTNHLVERGHQVVILCKDPKPDWRIVKADYIQVPPHMGFVQMMPEVDVIVCAVSDQLVECYSMQKAPVVMFEQGDAYIYEFDKVPASVQKFHKQIWSYPVPIVGVSKVLLDTLEDHFGRRGQILHNALDEQYFYPRSQQSQVSDKLRILFVGMEDNKFKGIQDIRQALAIVRESGRDFDEVWVAQHAPKSSFEGTMVVNPSQEQLGDIYRSCDISVSGSYYESFPLPPLEAMTCGCAVVSTDNKGVQEYGIDGVNCLLGRVGNPHSLAERIVELIDDHEKRRQLVENGYRTAERFRWETIMAQWEQYLNGTIEVWQQQFQALSIPSLRLEMLPGGLSHQEARERIHQVQQQVQEDWVLYLIEGETIAESTIEQIKRILAGGVESVDALQVIYSDDVPEHPIIRAEHRLLKRQQPLPEARDNPVALPLQIHGATESYFLVSWLDNVRALYRSQQYQELVGVVQAHYRMMTVQERMVGTKWMMLALLELDRVNEVVQLGNQAMGQDFTYSDLLYLVARVCLMVGRAEVSQQLFEAAQQIDSAIHYPETFFGIRELAEIYL